MVKLTVHRSNRKPTIAEPAERCEASSYASTFISHRCTNKGELYTVAGDMTSGIARLCGTHRAGFERAGYKLESLTPLDRQIRKAVTS